MIGLTNVKRTSYYTYSINSVKNLRNEDITANCNIILTASGYTQSGNSITVLKGTLINVFISCKNNDNQDYVNYNESIFIDSNITRNIVLKDPIIYSNLNSNVQSIISYNLEANGDYDIEIYGGSALRISGSSIFTTKGGRGHLNFIPNVNTTIALKAIKSGSINSGCGIGLWINENCIMVAGGAASATYSAAPEIRDWMNSSGGGGYIGGWADPSASSFPGYIATSGYSIDGNIGNYNDTSDGSGQYAIVAYGGSGYKNNNYNITLYTDHIGDPNFKITRLA